MSSAQGERKKLDYYFESVRKAGAEPADDIRWTSPAQLHAQLVDLDGFVLPGSPADVDPARYGAAKHPKTNELDENRDRTDFAILDHAFETGKPVLAICFGCQSLNVYRKGTLIQDIRGRTARIHRSRQTDLPSGLRPGISKGDLEHSVMFSAGSLLARLNRSHRRHDQQQPPSGDRQARARVSRHRPRQRRHHRRRRVERQLELGRRRAVASGAHAGGCVVAATVRGICGRRSQRARLGRAKGLAFPLLSIRKFRGSLSLGSLGAS